VTPGEHPDPWRTTTLVALGEEFQRLEDEQLQRRPEHNRRRRVRLQVVSGLTLLILTAGVLGILFTQHAPRALADVTDAAAAAEKAKTFGFDSKSVFKFADGSSQSAEEAGTVDFVTPAYRARIDSGAGSGGFERVVFAHALYERRVGPHASPAWIGVHLQPRAVIAPVAGASSGVADPLGLLDVLSRGNRAMRVGRQQIDGVQTLHYRLRSTLGEFLRAQGQKASPTQAATPVVIDVWLDDANRVRLASRLFLLDGHGHGGAEQLLITTSFSGYGAPVRLRAPAGVRLVGTQPLNPVADDAVSANLGGQLAQHSRHPATPAIRKQTR
jgi:hypothetical protein